FSCITGTSKHRLPKEMTLLGAPEQLVDQVRRLPEEQQEEAFIAFAHGKQACMLDWKAQRDDVFADLVPLLSTDEKQLLPVPNECPGHASGTIAKFRSALSGSERRLVHTESLGDFSFLILVPKDKEQEFVAAVGPWLIEDQF